MTSSIESVPRGQYVPTADERIVLRNFTWEGFQTLLELKGDRYRPRVTYLDGALELMPPSFDHERIKSRIGAISRLLVLPTLSEALTQLRQTFA